MTTSQHNDALLRNAFAQALVIDPSQVTDDLTYNSIAAWDSTAHMLLIAELENVVGGIPNWTMAALIARIRQAEARIKVMDEALREAETTLRIEGLDWQADAARTARKEPA